MCARCCSCPCVVERGANYVLGGAGFVKWNRPNHEPLTMVSTYLKSPLWLTLIPGAIMLVIGIPALYAAFRKAEELEVA